MVYIRMLHAPQYKSFLPLYMNAGLVDFYIGRTAMDVKAIDDEEYYDITFEQGLTVTGSEETIQRVKRILEELRNNCREEDKSFCIEDFGQYFILSIDSIGDKALYEARVSGKPFVILDVPDNIFVEALERLKRIVLGESPEAPEDVGDYLFKNSRTLVIFHRWMSLDEAEKIAKITCSKKGVEPESFEYYKCIDEEVRRIAQNYKPELIDAVYYEYGKLKARGRDVLKYAYDLLPEKEMNALRKIGEIHV